MADRTPAQQEAYDDGRQSFQPLLKGQDYHVPREYWPDRDTHFHEGWEDARAEYEAPYIAMLERNEMAKKAEKTDNPENVPGAWVLTREHNEYDQQGEYFVACWGTKPTTKALADFMAKVPHAPRFQTLFDTVAFLEHLLEGGGRQKHEDVWFHLRWRPFESGH